MKIGMSAKVITLFLIAGIVPLGVMGMLGLQVIQYIIRETGF